MKSPIQVLQFWLEVDGKRYQAGSTATMIFSVKEIISYLNRFMRLLPGDIIATGTPRGGVGMGQKPQPVFLRAGQRLRLGVEGLGRASAIDGAGLTNGRAPAS